MTQLLEKEAKFKWSPQCEEAFLTLKKLLTTVPVLAQPDIEKSFDMYCDASAAPPVHRAVDSVHRFYR
jgi:hypothetical protein